MSPLPDDLQAVLFDLDGTLVETDDQAVKRVADRLRPILGSRSEAAGRWLLMQAETPGNMLITALDFLGLDERMMGLTDWLRRKRGVYPAPEFHLVAGVAEMLLGLQAYYRLAIVTTRSRYHVDRFLEAFPAIAPAVSTTCALQDTRRLKPHPAPVRLAAKRLGVPVDRCLMVGDTQVDIRAGRRAGAWTAGVLCGFGQEDELNRAGAHVVLASTADLLHVLK